MTEKPELMDFVMLGAEKGIKCAMEKDSLNLNPLPYLRQLWRGLGRGAPPARPASAVASGGAAGAPPTFWQGMRRPLAFGSATAAGGVGTDLGMMGYQAYTGAPQNERVHFGDYSLPMAMAGGAMLLPGAMRAAGRTSRFQPRAITAPWHQQFRPGVVQQAAQNIAGRGLRAAGTVGNYGMIGAPLVALGHGSLEAPRRGARQQFQQALQMQNEVAAGRPLPHDHPGVPVWNETHPEGMRLIRTPSGWVHPSMTGQNGPAGTQPAGTAGGQPASGAAPSGTATAPGTNPPPSNTPNTPDNRQTGRFGVAGIDNLWKDLPNWGKGLGVGAGALGAGALAHSLFGHDDEEDEHGQPRRRSGSSWLPALAGLGALGGGAYWLKGQHDWKDLIDPKFWQKTSSARLPLILCNRLIKSGEGTSAPQMPAPHAPPTNVGNFAGGIGGPGVNASPPMPNVNTPAVPSTGGGGDWSSGGGSDPAPTTPAPQTAYNLSPPNANAPEPPAPQATAGQQWAGFGANLLNAAPQRFMGMQFPQQVTDQMRAGHTALQNMAGPAAPAQLPGPSQESITAQQASVNTFQNPQSSVAQMERAIFNQRAPSGESAAVANQPTVGAPGQARNYTEHYENTMPGADGSQGMGGGTNIAVRMAQLRPESMNQPAGIHALTQQIRQQQGDSPGLMDSVMQIWNSIGPQGDDRGVLGTGMSWMQILLCGGLSIGAIGLLGSLMGSGQGGGIGGMLGGGSGMLLGLGGLAAGAYAAGAFDPNSSLRRLFGGGPQQGGGPQGQSSAGGAAGPQQGGGPQGQSSAGGAAGPGAFNIADIRQIAETNPQQAILMIAQAGRNDSSLAQNLRLIATNTGLSPATIAGSQQARAAGITEQDVQMIRTNWPAIQAALQQPAPQAGPPAGGQTGPPPAAGGAGAPNPSQTPAPNQPAPTPHETVDNMARSIFGYATAPGGLTEPLDPAQSIQNLTLIAAGNPAQNVAPNPAQAAAILRAATTQHSQNPVAGSVQVPRMIRLPNGQEGPAMQQLPNGQQVPVVDIVSRQFINQQRLDAAHHAVANVHFDQLRHLTPEQQTQLVQQLDPHTIHLMQQELQTRLSSQDPERAIRADSRPQIEQLMNTLSSARAARTPTQPITQGMGPPVPDPNYRLLSSIRGRSPYDVREMIFAHLSRPQLESLNTYLNGITPDSFNRNEGITAFEINNARAAVNRLLPTPQQQPTATR